MIAEALHHPLLLEWSALDLCADAALAGDWDEAHMYARQALSLRNYGRVYVGFTRWHETEALLRGGDVEQATEDVRRMSEQFADNQRYEMQERRALAVLARWQGDIDQAIVHLEAARVLAEGMGLLHDRWQIEAALAEAYLDCGDEERARQAFARAGGIVLAFANNLTDDKLRATFLAAGPVRRLLNQS